MTDDARLLLRDPGEITRDVHQIDQGDVETVAEADEPRRLVGGVHVEAAGLDARLVGDDADGAARHAGEADDHVGGEARQHFEERLPIDDALYHRVHVVGFLEVGRNDLLEAVVHPLGVVPAVVHRRSLRMVRGQNAQEPADGPDALGVALRQRNGPGR